MVDFDKHIGLAIEFCKDRFQNYSHLAEDIQQQAYIGLWRACRTFDDTKGYEFSTYAYKCMKNEVLLFLRKEDKFYDIAINYQIDHEEGTVDLVDIQSTTKYNECQDFRKMQKRLLEKVNIKWRRTFKLFTEGYKQTEIAQILFIAPSTVSRRLKIIIEQLKQEKDIDINILEEEYNRFIRE